MDDHQGQTATLIREPLPAVAPAAPAPVPTARAAPLAGRRLDVAVGGLLAVLAVGFMLPGVWPGRVAAPMDQLLVFPPWQSVFPGAQPIVQGGDPLLQQIPWHEWAAREWAAGRFPLWDSVQAGGMPVFANMQLAPLYPLHLLWALLPTAAGLGVVMILKLWLAGLGMWGFLRGLGLHPAAGLLSAVGFEFSTSLVNWLPWQHSAVYLLLPWGAWAIDAWARRRRRGALVGLILVAASALLGGEPEIALMMVVALAIWSAALLLGSPRRDWPRQITGLLVAVGLAALIGAIQVLPFLEIVGLTHQGAQRAAHPKSAAALHLGADMIQWLLPRYWSYPPEGVISNYPFTVTNGYVGLLAVVGLGLTVLAGARRRLAFRRVVPWVLAGGLAWLITYDDGVGHWLRSLPGLNQSLSVYWLLIVGFALLVVSAFGWDWLARRPDAAGRAGAGWWPRTAWGGAALVLLVEGVVGLVLLGSRLIAPPAIGGPLGHWAPPTDDYRLYWAAWAGAVTLTTLGLAGWWATAPRIRRVAPLLLAGLLVLDLWQLLVPVNGSAPAADYYPTTRFIRQAVAAVQAPDRILAEGDGLPADSALVYGLRDWRTQDPLMSERAHQAAVLLSPTMPGSIWTDYNMFLDDVHLAIAPLLGMRYFMAVTPSATLSQTDPGRPPMTRLAYVDGMGLWRLEGVPGFSYLSDQVTAVPDGPAAATWLGKVTWAQTRAYAAVVEALPAALAAVAPGPAGTSPGSTTVLTYTPGSIRIQAQATRPALLVVAESWYPGWRATLDGRPAPILRANYLSQSVVVPAGTHTVELTYAPDSFTIGAWLSALGLAGLLGLCGWVVWSGRRKQQQQREEPQWTNP